ncbi:hypothetical protein RFI_30033, partial [Reticulomyxa filosa]
QRKLLFKKHQHMVKSIDSLHEGNTRNLFTQFKALNTNKICIIPALVNKEMNSVARSDADKAYLLAKTFAEPPQPPKDVDEKHYEMVLHQTQAGFQSWHNTDELLLRLIYKSFDCNSVTYAVLLDISAAYDILFFLARMRSYPS